MMDSNPNMKFSLALSTAIFAKNTLLNTSGFSPMQIAFGLQPRIPGAGQNNRPPANEDIIESVPIYKRLTALFEARKAFMDVENSLRLKKALRVKPQPMEFYNNGDKVYYKFGTDPRWHGPGTIIGTDNKVIFLRHGGNVISTSQSRIVKADTTLSEAEGKEHPLQCKESQPSKELQLRSKTRKLGNSNKEEDSDTDSEHEEHCPPLPSTHQTEENAQNLLDEENEQPLDLENREYLEKEGQVRTSGQQPKQGDWIEYKEKQGDTWFRATILKRTSKSTKNKRVHYNIDREYGGPAGIVLDEYDWRIIPNPNLKTTKKFQPGPSIHSQIEYSEKQIDNAECAELENQNYVVFIPKKDWSKPFVVEAKNKEIQNFDRYGAYKTVTDEGQPRLTSGWIITEKLYGDVVGCKARLVVHGNQEMYEVRSDSPTVTKQSLRLVFTIAAQFGWEVITSDVTSAFLQSDKLDREVFVQPPSDIRVPGTLWRLETPMYGLDDSGLKWYKTVDNKLRKLGCQRLHTDLAVFYYIKDNKLRGITAWHVDDMITTWDEIFYNDIVKPLMDELNFGSTSEGAYRCLGWNIRHTENSILVSQLDNIASKVDYIAIDKDDRKNDETLNKEEAAIVRARIGKLRWLSDQTRPDIAYDLLELSIGAHNPNVGMISIINKTVTAVNSRKVEIRYGKLEGDHWYITVFSDASLRGLSGKVHSAMGYLIFLSDGYIPNKSSKCCILTWKSCKVKRVVTSTYDAETISLELGLEEAIVIKDQLVKMTGFNADLIEIEAFVDCKDTYEAIISNKKFPKGSRLASIEVAKIKEMLEMKQIQRVSWVDTYHQMADVLTKRGVGTEVLVNTINSGRFYK